MESTKGRGKLAQSTFTKSNAFRSSENAAAKLTMIPTSDSILSKIEHVKGNISCRFDGFLKAKNHALTLMSPADSFAIELDTFPETFRFSSVPSTLSSLANSAEVDSIAEWGVDTSFSITWSPQQRNASYIKLSLFQQDGRYKNSGSKRFVGMTIVDLPSILLSPDSTFLYCLPIYAPGGSLSLDNLLGWVCLGLKFSAQESGVGNEFRSEVESFWRRILSLDTSIHHALIDIPIQPELLRPSETILITDPPTTSYNVHLALGELALTSMVQRQLSKASSNDMASSLPNDLQNNEIKDTTMLSTTTGQKSFLAEIRLSTNYEVVSSITGNYNITTGCVQWAPADIVIPTQALADSSVVIDITLKLLTNESKYKQKRDLPSSAMSSTSLTTKFASCTLCISWAHLSAGRPLNYAIPMNDQQDTRIGNLVISMHSSALPTASTTASLISSGSAASFSLSATSSSVSNQVSTLSTSLTKYYLFIEYIEGHITQETGGSATLPPANDGAELLDTNTPTPTTSAALYAASDVFFESILLIHPENSSSSRQQCKFKSRSGYIASHRIQNWGLTSRILITPDIAQYLSKVRIWDAVSLGVTVRTSAYPGCPELGRARVALPNQIFQQLSINMNPKSRIVEQFVTLYSYETPSNIASGILSQAEQQQKKHFAGRVRMRISLQRESLLPMYRSILPDTTASNQRITSFSSLVRSIKCDHGFGSVLVRLIGVHSSRQPREDLYDEKILFATMNKSSSSSFEQEQAQLVDRVVLRSESFSSNNANSSVSSEGDYHNILSSSFLVGDIDVFSSSTSINVDIRSETALSTFTAHFPASKAIPRLPTSIDTYANAPNIKESSVNDSNLAMVVPEFVLNMAKKSKSGSTLVSPTQILDSPPMSPSRQHQMDQKVKIQACLVPYVEGVLHIQLFAPVIAPSILSTMPALQQQQAPMMSRISLGGPSEHFADTWLSLSQSQPSMASIRLNTFELLHPKKNPLSSVSASESGKRPLSSYDSDPNRNDGRGMMPLFFDIFSDVSSTLASSSQIAQTVHIHAEKTPLFVGALDTAPIYLLALRALLSSASAATTSNSTAMSSSATVVASAPYLASASTTGNSRKRQSNTSAAANYNAGKETTTPSSSAGSDLVWLSSFVDLYRPSTIPFVGPQKKLVGRLPVRIAFRPENLPFFVADLIQTLLRPPPIIPQTSTLLQVTDGTNKDASANKSLEEERLRTELGLKQAFVAADADGSGAISSSELLAVIQNGRHQNDSINNRSKPTVANTIVRSASTTRLGLENTSQLLSALAHLGDDTLINRSSSYKGNKSNRMRQRSLLTSSSTPAFSQTMSSTVPMSTSASTSQLPLSTMSITNRNKSADLEPVSEDKEEEGGDSFDISTEGVASIFRKIDLDGDGMITWCEWKSVLTIALQLQQWQHFKRQQQSRTIEDDEEENSDGLSSSFNLLDPLFVLLFAAMDILSITSPLTHYPEELSLSQSNNAQTNNLEDIEDTFTVLPKQFATDTLNNADKKPAGGDGAVSTTTTTVDDMLLPSSKVSSRLNNLVQSLRVTNNLLAQRLESAITSTAISPAVEQQAAALTTLSPTNNENESSKLHEQTQLYVRAFRKEHQHANTLRNEVLALQAEVDQLKQNKPVDNNATKIARPSNQIEKNIAEITAVIADRLQFLEVRKLQQRREAEATLKLNSFFNKHVIPKHHRRREEIAKKVLVRWLTRFMRRYRLKKQIARKNQAVTLIQQYHRGKFVRNQFKRKLVMATRLQRLYRGFLGRRYAQVVRQHVQQVQLFRQTRAVRVIVRLWRAFHKQRIEKARRVIREQLCQYSLRKQAKKKLENLRWDKMNAVRILCSVISIQRTFRRWKLRRDARRELLRRRAKRDFYQHRAQLINWKRAKPSIEEAVGFWVADVSSLMGDLNYSIDVVIPEHVFMYIEKVDTNTRVCTVKYLPQQTNPEITPDMQHTFVAYDHPLLSWYSVQEPPKEKLAEAATTEKKHRHHHKRDNSDGDMVSSPPSPALSSSSSSVSNEDNDSGSIEITQEDALVAAHLQLLLYKYVMFSPDGGEMDSRFGTVTKYNVNTRSIGIEFQAKCNPARGESNSSSTAAAEAPPGTLPAAAETANEIEWLAFDHPYIIWLQTDGSLLPGFNHLNQHFHNNSNSQLSTHMGNLASPAAAIPLDSTAMAVAAATAAVSSATGGLSFAPAASGAKFRPAITTPLASPHKPSFNSSSSHHHHHHQPHTPKQQQQQQHYFFATPTPASAAHHHHHSSSSSNHHHHHSQSISMSMSSSQQHPQKDKDHRHHHHSNYNTPTTSTKIKPQQQPAPSSENK